MITGHTIFEEIKGLMKEIEEHDKALEALKDSVGRDSIAYRRIKDIREESQMSLEAAKKARYEVPSKKLKKSFGEVPMNPNPDLEEDDDFLF